MDLIESDVECPYCAEVITVLVDDSLPEQNYVEDCQVCCRPIVFDVRIGADGRAAVSVRAENE